MNFQSEKAHFSNGKKRYSKFIFVSQVDLFGNFSFVKIA
jgi:hypothetical protein